MTIAVTVRPTGTGKGLSVVTSFAHPGATSTTCRCRRRDDVRRVFFVLSSFTFSSLSSSSSSSSSGGPATVPTAHPALVNSIRTDTSAPVAYGKVSNSYFEDKEADEVDASIWASA